MKNIITVGMKRGNVFDEPEWVEIDGTRVPGGITKIAFEQGANGLGAVTLTVHCMRLELVNASPDPK